MRSANSCNLISVPRHRIEAVATCLTPGAHRFEGKVAGTTPICEPIIAHVSLGFARAPQIQDDITRALDAAARDGVAPILPGGIVDITAYLAERMPADA